MVRYLFLLSVLCSLQSFANVRGSDLQNFNPNPNGKGFVTVLPSETLQPLQFNVGGFINFSTNSLAYSTVSGAPNTQNLTEPNDSLLYSNLHLALGIIEGWEASLAAGFINAQDIDQSNFLFSYGDTGINDVMLTTKVRLINEQNWGFAFAAGADFEQIKNNPFVGDDAGPAFSFEGVIDFMVTPRLIWAFNLGYRLRQDGVPIPNTGVTPMSDQITYSTALAYRVDDSGSAIIGEAYGSYPVEQFTLPTDRQISNLELLASYRWRATDSFDLHSGIGTEVYQGLGSPDFRIFVGCNLHFDQNSSSQQQGPMRVFDPR